MAAAIGDDGGTAGAGMGVDMGLLDFRSSDKFWKELNHPEIVRYEDSSDSAWFENPIGNRYKEVSIIGSRRTPPSPGD